MLHSVTESAIMSSEISKSVPICRLSLYGYEVQIPEGTRTELTDISKPAAYEKESMNQSQIVGRVSYIMEERRVTYGGHSCIKYSL